LKGGTPSICWERERLIVDCHVHSDWTWPSLGGICRQGNKKDLRAFAKSIGIDKICVSSAKAIEYDFVEGNSDLLALMRELPDLIWGQCMLNPRFGELALEEFDRCVVKGGMVGLGEIYPVLPLWRADEASFFPVMEKVTKHRVPALIHADPLEAIYSLADRFPDAPIIMAHMGGGGGLQGITGPIYETKRYDNLYLDTGTSHMESNMIEEAVKVVGADRVIFGTDFPLLEPNAQIQKIRSSRISEGDRRLILGENMARLVGRRKI
jgi:predicted TIM-barrel fold metal-dependent hydrolase